jgi:hypothetical protein
MLVIVRGCFGMVRVRTTRAACLEARTEGFVHDLLDGARATAALGAAAQAAVNLTRSAREILCGHGVSHVVVGEDVTGANDHGWKLVNPVKTWRIDKSRGHRMQKQNGQFQAIPNWDASSFPTS